MKKNEPKRCPRCHGRGKVMVQNYVGLFDDDEKYIICLEPGCHHGWVGGPAEENDDKGVKQ
jgi:hypothetical protein